MRIGPDPANGATYQPAHRVGVWDFVPKHNPHKHCTPHYPSDDNPAAVAYYHDPIAYYHHALAHDPSRVNTTSYHKHPPAPGVVRSSMVAG